MAPGRLTAQIDALATPILEGDDRGLVSLRTLLGEQNPIDVARILSDLDAAQVTLVFDQFEREAQSVLLSEASPREQALLLMHVGDRGAQLIAHLEPDDAADVLDAVPEADREALLSDLEAEDAQEIRELREYPADTAGGLMTPEVVSVDVDATQEQILRVIRESHDAETVNVIYVTNHGTLVGVASIRDVIRAQPRTPIREYMTTDLITVGPEQDQEVVIRLMETYHLGAIPVVTPAGRLLGMVTSDDVMTALEDEASEDIMALAGAGTYSAGRTVRERVRARMPWLLVTLIGGITAGWVIRALDQLLGGGGDAVVKETAQLLPLVAGLAGNVGMQSSAVMLRGFATGEINRSRLKGVIRDEILAGLINGILCGLVSGIMAVAITGSHDIRRFGAVGISVAVASTMAGTLGAVVPTTCYRLGIDPAVSAGPFITTLNDILGFAIYMTVCLGLFSLRQ
jgi:magnesium transporter